MTDHLKTPQDHIRHAFATGDRQKVTAYLSKYWKDVVHYYKKDTGTNRQVEGEGTENTLGGNREGNGQTVLPRLQGGAEADAKEVFNLK